MKHLLEILKTYYVAVKNKAVVAFIWYMQKQYITYVVETSSPEPDDLPLDTVCSVISDGIYIYLDARVHNNIFPPSDW